MAARAAAEAEGYFDLEVTCVGPFQVPPQACFLDGVQVATGATWGKRNVHWEPGDAVAVRVVNKRTGAEARVTPTDTLTEWLGALAPPARDNKDVTPSESSQGHNDEDHTRYLESIARDIATAPDEVIARIEA